MADDEVKESMTQEEAIQQLAKSLGLNIKLLGGAKKEGESDDKTPQGSLNTSYTIYQGPKDDNDEYTWLDQEPSDVPEAAENSETAKHAVVIRSKKSCDSRKKFEIHSLVVQSPWLRKALGEILKGYPGVCCDLERLIFEAPFAPFVHRWKSFTEFFKGDHDKTTIEHMNLLKDILEEELKDTLKSVEDYIAKGVITWDNLWAIFQPGEHVYSSSVNGSPGIAMFNSGAYIETRCGKMYDLTCDIIDWNGTYFGTSEVSLKISQYLGTKPITSLRSFPLQFHPSKESLVRVMTERGKKFEALAGFHYKQYNSFAIGRDREHKPVRVHITGRIIVDAESWDRFSPYYSEYIEPVKAKELEESDDQDSDGSFEDIDQTWDNRKPRVRLDPKYYVICSPKVRGYSLKAKRWVEYFVDNIEEITWNSSAFDGLVLPDDQKELILSFTESQVVNREQFDDVIQGKGKGMIMLLSGPPGVGKTLTAESVAENMRAPLYMMSAGDLGTYASDVEYHLSKILDMVARWNAVLLLDECDVFLEERSANDLQRNKLVSIFLRTLEYYEGLLFLTTNRIDNIDAAFKSRIHVSMAYPDLTAKSRHSIWENFLKVCPNSLSSSDLEELSHVHLNGREIKNLLKTARLLAARKQTILNREHINVVLAIEQRRPENQKN